METRSEVTAWLLGESRAIREVRRQVRILAALDEPVLIEGESGSGKRLVARAIHQASPRRDGPFRVASPIGLGGLAALNGALAEPDAPTMIIGGIAVIARAIMC